MPELPDLSALPSELQDDARQRLDALRRQPALAERIGHGGWWAAAPMVLAVSRFAAELCETQPQLLGELIDSGRLETAEDEAAFTALLAAALEGCDDEADLRRRLRRLRQREMLRIAWRDLAGWADLDQTLTALTALADGCLDGALRQLHAWQAQQLGEPCDADGRPVRLVVLGMGKLGGGELNFSSDIDLMFAFEHAGTCSGPRGLSNEEFFLRLARRLIGALDDLEAGGRVFRVDMRLRPFGSSGPLVASFDAMEDYYQSHGRDWERYALIKARPVAGDVDAGERLLERLRPFVFRRYLDFGAIDALRNMKALIVEQVRREGLDDHVKLGAGGIREVEFIGQVHQLIRGGREPDLRCRGLRPLLRLLGERGHLPQAAVDELLAGYAFLRRFENHLQMLKDRQTHQVPTDPLDQARMALAMGHADWAACRHDLAEWRARVHGHFSDLLGAPDTAAPDHPLWPDRLEQAGAADELRALGMDDPEQALSHLRALRDGRACRVASATARQRLSALLPGLLRAAATTERPTLTLGRLCTLLDAVATRSVYLAMLLEHPPAQDHLARLMAVSAWVADWITRHPVVLDELLDARTLYRPLDTVQIERELDRALAGVDADDLETAMNVLRDHRYAAALHVAAAEIGNLLQPDQAPKALTALAEALLRRALTLARTPLERRHGLPRRADDGAKEAPLLVLGYGRLGSGELNYESDLDLVFLHDGSGGESDGAASLANETWFARVVQRLTHVLTTLTPAGRLYEIDVRLRPSGNAGPLVTSLSGFETYQREEAWTWEHQALVRARPVAGDDGLAQRFEAVRRQVLCQPRDAARLRRDVADMRRRIRDGKGLPAQGFELKLSPGGRVDVEFIAQYLVLAHAHAEPVLTEPRGTADILSLAGELGLLATDTAAALGEAFVALCALERRQTLDGAGTVVAPQRVAPQQAAIGAAWRSLIEG